MSILERMRGSTDSTPMQIVLVLIVVAFIGWFSVPNAETVQVAVEVDGERVLQQEFNQRYFQEQRLETMQRGRRLDDTEESELIARVKDKMAAEIVVKQEAERLGYTASPVEIGRMIKSEPRFQTPDGTFDKELYDEELKASGRSRSDFEGDFRDRVLRDKLRADVTIGVQIPRGEVVRRYNEALTAFDLSFIEILPGAVAEAEPPTDEERAAWIADNGDKLKAAYEKDRLLKYDLPERVRLSVIRLDVGNGDQAALTERMQSVRDEIVNGATFASMARRWSEDATAPSGGDMGQKRVPTLTTAQREAIEGVAAGDITDVVDEGDFISLFMVKERIPAEVTPIEDVQDELAVVAMRAERAEAFANRVADVWRQGESLVELLEPVGATIQPLPDVPPKAYPAMDGQPPADAIEALAESDDGTIVGPFSRPGRDGDKLYVVRLDKRKLPNPDDSPQMPGGVEAFHEIVLDAERDQVWTAYVQALQAKADVDTGGGEAKQGGIMSYLPELPEWLAPKS